MEESKSLPGPGPRGTRGKLKRIATLDLESVHDFISGFRFWAIRNFKPATVARIETRLKEKGLEPDASVSQKDLLDAIGEDPLIWMSVRAAVSIQRHSHHTLLDECNKNAERYLAEMKAAETKGPGSLSLDPELVVPDYAKHEIHMQPGGYVGSEFAGIVYHYSTNNFYAGLVGNNNQDQIHHAMVRNVEAPPDARVERVLDLGCGPGQLTLALKNRFDTAEVWGLDVSAPMVRYAHLRATELDTEVHFTQQLAEGTKFPDDHFDVVTAYLLFHEIPTDVTRAVAKEAFRITRPGGIFYPIDFAHTDPDKKPPSQKFLNWWDHRWNNEVWTPEFSLLDFPEVIRDAGFQVEVGPPRMPGFENIIAKKPE